MIYFLGLVADNIIVTIVIINVYEYRDRHRLPPKPPARHQRSPK